MNKWWSLVSIILILLLTIGLFYYIPNGALITFATLPYIIWWAVHSRKSHYLLVPMLFIVIIFMLFVIPIMDVTGAATDIDFFARMYEIIYPNSFSYSWQQQIPAVLPWTLGIAVSFILFAKILLWICGKLYHPISKQNFVLSLSCVLIYILFFYTLINLIPALIGGESFNSFKSVFALSLFYDICFVWGPFIILYFLFDWIVSRIIGN